MDSDHPLGFVIWGVARSGTTALERAANLVPGIFCLHEGQIGFQPQPPEPRFPRFVLGGDRGWIGAEELTRARALLRAKLKAGGVALYGNKHPGYVSIVSQLRAQFPDCRNLVIHRGTAGFLRSWDVKAARQRRGWDVHQTGLIGLWEWILALDALASFPERTLVVSFDAIFTGDLDCFGDLVGRLLGSPADQATRARFEAELFRQGPDDSGAEADEIYRPILASVGAPDLDRAVRGWRLADAADHAAYLRAFVDAAAPKVARFVTGALAASGCAEKQRFAATWLGLRQHRYGKSTRPSAAVLEGFGLLLRQAATA
ncbi:hypothetical protein ACLF3G_07190 [Falsiroseomonas sp. HC035]|uniref:hypothetical protein n=1 Tax=Falsiroseomonas sp. HC035 TaxID=3390999 RepID=UPI003D3140A9